MPMMPSISRTLVIWQYRLLMIHELVQEHPASMAMHDAIIDQVGKNPEIVAVTKAQIEKGRGEKGFLIADSASYFYSDERVGPREPAGFRR